MNVEIKSVLVSDDIDEVCLKILKENGITVDFKTKLKEDELVQIIPNYNGLVVRSATKVTSRIIEAGKNLRIIGRAGVGVDNIDINAASENGVIVMNTPFGNTQSACELACAMILGLSRNLHNASNSMKEGKWDRKKFMGSEVGGKTLAIVGLGNIGREVAIRMQAFGMRTIGYDPLISKEQAAEFNVEWMELGEIWPVADYITVHVPLIPATENMINKDVFMNKCKKGVCVINCARGGIINEDDLLWALNEDYCGGAGLDVFTEEPPKTDNLKLLTSHEKVLATPHLGASTVEAQFRVAKEIAEQFVSLNRKEKLSGAINANHLSCLIGPEGEISNLVKSSIAAGKLAALWAGVQNLDVTSLELSLNDSTKFAQRGLLSALCVGFMSNDQQKNVNLISGATIARQSKIEFTCKFTSEVKSGLVDVSINGLLMQFKLCSCAVGTFLVQCGKDGKPYSLPPLLSGKFTAVANKNGGDSSKQMWQLDSNWALSSLEQANVAGKNVVDF